MGSARAVKVAEGGGGGRGEREIKGFRVLSSTFLDATNFEETVPHCCNRNLFVCGKIA